MGKKEKFNTQWRTRQKKAARVAFCHGCSHPNCSYFFFKKKNHSKSVEKRWWRWWWWWKCKRAHEWHIWINRRKSTLQLCCWNRSYRGSAVCVWQRYFFIVEVMLALLSLWLLRLFVFVLSPPSLSFPICTRAHEIGMLCWRKRKVSIGKGLNTIKVTVAKKTMNEWRTNGRTTRARKKMIRYAK